MDDGPDTPPSLLLTPEEAATFFKVTPGTVKKWLRSGKLKGSKLGCSKAGEWRTTLENCVELYDKGRNY